MTPTKIFPARPTVYNGIKMRSRLEAKFAQTLDTNGGVGRWSYEPNCFASPEGQYLPDFLLTVGPLPEYIEVKPAYMASDLDAIRKIQKTMEIIWASEPDAGLNLVFPEIKDWYRAQGLGPIPWMRVDRSLA